MKTILVLSASTVVAHVVRALEVSKLLRGMGYRVIFGGGGRPLAAVQAAGFEVRPLPEFDIAWALARIWQGPAAVHTVEMVEQFVAAEVALLRELRPDVVFQDGRLTASTTAAIAGRPLISLSNAYGTPYAVNGLLSFKSPGPPPLVGPGGEVAYNVVRTRFGLPPVGSVLELMVGDLNLMCDAAEYAPVANALASFHYVGPIIWNGPAAPLPWLAELDPTRPTIYFTMGSTGPAEAFRVGFQAFGDTEYQVLLTTGGLVQPADLPPAPANFHLIPMGPGDLLARRADVVVCHGGNGTAYQALTEGVPLVAWPYVQDQHWNARRQAELGLGVTVAAPTADALRAAVAEALDNPAYRAAAGRFKTILAGYNGPQTAAELIDKFLRKS
ncbi:MAG: glycosyltransferase [Chloroflexi bacterium]|nr:glycosyltransferase [Chloroflexota bacterium]